MIRITTCTLPAEDIASWIAEIEREHPTLPRGERRVAREQLRQLRDEFGIRDEFDRIETEQRYFTAVEATHRRSSRTGSNCRSEAEREGVHETPSRSRCAEDSSSDW
jgi:hypothetical protein